MKAKWNTDIQSVKMYHIYFKYLDTKKPDETVLSQISGSDRVKLVIKCCRFDPCLVWQHSSVAIDHEIFSVVILPIPLIQEGQLSVSGEKVCTVTG